MVAPLLFYVRKGAEIPRTPHAGSRVSENPVNRKPSFREAQEPATGFPRMSLLGNLVNRGSPPPTSTSNAKATHK